jgi:hypothetical protein
LTGRLRRCQRRPVVLRSCVGQIGRSFGVLRALAFVAFLVLAPGATSAAGASPVCETTITVPANAAPGAATIKAASRTIRDLAVKKPFTITR